MDRSRRIMREIQRLMSDPPQFIRFLPYSGSSRYFSFTIQHPYYPYEGIFPLVLYLPKEYPMEPPKVKFLVKVYHPNISVDGEVSLSILRDEWAPYYHFYHAILGIQFLFSIPNAEDPLNIEAAQHWIRDRKGAEMKAMEWTRTYANGLSNISWIKPWGDDNTTNTPSDLGIKMNFQGEDGFSIPLDIFSGFQYEDMDIHESVHLIMQDQWTANVFEMLKFSEERLSAWEGDLTLNEAGAIMYYTSHAQFPLYMKLNGHLAERNVPPHFKPFLYCFFSGLKKLPDFKGTVYRGIKDTRLSLHPNKLYEPNKTVVWVALTSTSQNPKIPKGFLKDQPGSLCKIEVIEGKDISGFSLYKKEKEVLLLPNTYLEVCGYLEDDLKQMLLSRVDIDVITLKQKPTPAPIKNWY